jgi:hypothetical protein
LLADVLVAKSFDAVVVFDEDELSDAFCANAFVLLTAAACCVPHELVLLFELSDEAPKLEPSVTCAACDPLAVKLADLLLLLAEFTDPLELEAELPSLAVL